MYFSVLSHTLGAVGFSILFFLLVTSWRGRAKGGLLIFAVSVNMLWAIVTTFYLSTDDSASNFDMPVFEVIRSAAWLLLLFELLRPLLIVSRHSRTIIYLFYPGIILIACISLFVEFFSGWFADPEIQINTTMSARIGLALIGLVMIEQLFRNTRLERRWATKFLYLGIGTIFAYDFFLYTDALLFKQIDEQIWAARGLVHAIVVPFIALSAARNPEWSLDVFVSRRVVIHSVVVIGAGVYLLAMAGAGYYIRYFGGNWGTALQMVFFVGSGLILITLIFSGHMRSIITVFLSKHFFNYKYDYREEWLKFNDTLSSSELIEPLRERAVRAIAEILHSPGGLLWTRGNDEHFYLSANWNTPEYGAHKVHNDSNFIQFIEHKNWVIDINDYDNDPNTYYPGLKLPDWLLDMPNAWLIVPLMQGKELRGFIVLLTSRAFFKLNWEDRDLLKTAGRQVASYAAMLDATDALMDARQFEAFNRLSAYVVHDLKNVAAQLSLVVTNAAKHKDNPVFVDDAINTVANATAKMNRMLSQLRKGAPPESEIKTFRLYDAVNEVVESCSVGKPVPQLKFSDKELMLKANRDRFSAVIEHLIQNAQEATADDGVIEVIIEQTENLAVIEIVDNGCGMDKRFIRERLFQPFNTTKGNAGMGIGVYESREFVLSLGGEINVASEPAKGTTFTLKLPLAGNGGSTMKNDSVTMDINQKEEVIACPSQIGNY